MTSRPGDRKNPGRGSGLALALRKPHFLVFSFTQAVSLFGDKLDYMALLAMLAYFSERLAWDASQAISFLSVVAALPTVLFAPVAGVLVDRWDRRKVMVGCDSARALIVLAIPLVALRTTNLPLIYGLAFTLFLLGLFFHTARLSIIPNLVGAASQPRFSRDKDVPPTRWAPQLLGANSFMSFTGRLATFLGMLVGGLIVDWNGWVRLGISPCWSAGFYLDSLTYLVSVVGLVVIFRSSAFRPPLSTSSGKRLAVSGQRSAFAQAWRIVGRTPPVAFVYASVLGLVVIGAAAIVLYIPIIQGPDGLGLGTKGVGFVAAIGSAGLVLASIGYGLVGHQLTKHKAILFSFIILGLVTAALSLAHSFVPVALLAFIAGAALAPIYIGMDTMIHESVPESVRGRIFSNREWVMHLAFGLSALAIGQLTRLFSGRKLLLAVGLLIAVAGITGFIVSRKSHNWR